jgi:hypothetical protein
VKNNVHERAKRNIIQNKEGARNRKCRQHCGRELIVENFVRNGYIVCVDVYRRVGMCDWELIQIEQTIMMTQWGSHLMDWR